MSFWHWLFGMDAADDPPLPPPLAFPNEDWDAFRPPMYRRPDLISDEQVAASRRVPREQLSTYRPDAP